MALAISTSWAASRYESGKEMLQEIKKLGFLDLELSFNLTSSMVSEIKEFAGSFGFDIGSVHNFCPIPEGFKRQDALPDCYSMSSLDKEERDLAVKFTKRSIDTACSLGAKVVVLHCGRVEIIDQTKKLIDLYYRGLKDTEAFQELRERFVIDRASVSQPFFDQALASLEKINKYAEDKGIYLGVENRFYYREIPNAEEIGRILNEFKSSNIFYWHDIGHAKVMENLGLVKRNDYLELYARKMLGIHLHNVIGCEDHLAPATGEINFADLKPYLKKETLKVIEVNEKVEAAEIKKSRQVLEEIFDGII